MPYIDIILYKKAYKQNLTYMYKIASKNIPIVVFAILKPGPPF